MKTIEQIKKEIDMLEKFINSDLVNREFKEIMNAQLKTLKWVLSES